MADTPSRNGTHAFSIGAEQEGGHLGVVIGGSLTKGLEVRLAGERPVEEIAAGRYVTIEAQQQKFFGMITDVELCAASEAVLRQPPEPDDDFLRSIFIGTAAYAVLHVMPMLRVTGTADSTPEPVKTVPSHFSEVRDATQAEVSQIFGEEDNGHFVVGSPLDMDVKVCLAYSRFIERSNGIFGKSGTGKTFLTRNILMHLIQKSGAQKDAEKRSVNLVFDMHNEYGWKGTSEGTASGEVKALKQVLASAVAVMTLDEASSRLRGVPVDAAVTIRYQDIEPGDIAVLQETLNLTDNAVEAAHELALHFGQERWLRETLDLVETDEQTIETLRKRGIHAATILNLRRGLRRLVRGKSFLVEQGGTDSVQTILRYLLKGTNVVLEFGAYGNDLPAYMLVANVLTRRLHDVYRERSEAAQGGRGERPPHLIITIEEAHKFLNPQIARQTIFGEIAREMRKYRVTLLIIDQRPSAIDDEVQSQIATRITCLLDNERDIDAVLGGISGARELRAVLAKLETKQQALILGHAVPMPVVVRTETYGTEDSYARFLQRVNAPRAGLDDLYG